MESLAKELEEICEDEQFSLGSLQEVINRIPPESQILEQHQSRKYLDDCYFDFLPRACHNKRVTVEIIQCLVQFSPASVRAGTYLFSPNREEQPIDAPLSEKETTSYPIHLACYNNDCPNDAVELLINEEPELMSHSCIVEDGWSNRLMDLHGADTYYRGLPLHYYLSRTSNRDIQTIKMLAEAYPDALLERGSSITSVEIVLLTPINDHRYDAIKEILQLFYEIEPTSLRTTNTQGETPLHMVLSDKQVTTEIVVSPRNLGPIHEVRLQHIPRV